MNLFKPIDENKSNKKGDKPGEGGGSGWSYKMDNFSL